jgi:hypothetical protein
VLSIGILFNFNRVFSENAKNKQMLSCISEFVLTKNRFIEFEYTLNPRFLLRFPLFLFNLFVIFNLFALINDILINVIK